jgi:hypothetical protein
LEASFMDENFIPEQWIVPYEPLDVSYDPQANFAKGKKVW